MASAIPSCGPCNVQHITKTSIVWCTECEDGLCPQCLKHHTASKASRNHNTLPITEYQELPSDVKKITENCDKHNEKYTIYCKRHECPCCGSCVVEDHIDCRDFVRLTNIIDKSKTSESLNEIEQSLSEMAENIERIRQNRENNMKTLSEKKQDIEKEIKETREKINNHLDKIQDAIMETLNTAEKKETDQISQLLALLDGKRAEISELQNKVIKIKQHATDLQIFFSIKQFENEVSCKNKFFQSLVDTDTLKESELSYHAHNVIHSFFTDIKKFGDVMIEKKTCNVILSRKKDRQAQMFVPHVSNMSVENINLKLHKTVNKKGTDTTGCCMFPDGRMAFTFYGLHVIKIFKPNGSKDFEVQTPTLAFDIAYIIEDNTLAVTSGESGRQGITIIDIENKNIKKEIPLNCYSYGITVRDKQLICSAAGKGIQLIDPYNNSTNEIVCVELPPYCYVAHFGDKIYHTNNNTDTVICYGLQGAAQWTFKNKILRGPCGISVDNDGNVYVVGKSSNNVVVISADGQQHKEILTATDGLSSPVSLSYDKSTNQILVANYGNTAMLFTLV
ncbi:unnamed protein product [Mytilus edulis]|uniref:B box-type domain-containing protein n=1 Tax=Mytilus edulis TaxID=6550 RepID=A0A8S3TV41_MYTED|nr:unnamed protein product [Mytilus edulis]